MAALELEGRSSVRRAVSGEAKSFGRNSIVHTWLLPDHYARAKRCLEVFEATAELGVVGLVRIRSGSSANVVQFLVVHSMEAKTETAREKVISQLGERLASTVLVEKNHVPLSLETSHPLWTDKAEMPRSVQLAQELLDTRRANS